MKTIVKILDLTMITSLGFLLFAIAIEVGGMVGLLLGATLIPFAVVYIGRLIIKAEYRELPESKLGLILGCLYRIIEILFILVFAIWVLTG